MHESGPSLLWSGPRISHSQFDPRNWIRAWCQAWHLAFWCPLLVLTTSNLVLSRFQLCHLGTIPSGRRARSPSLWIDTSRLNKMETQIGLLQIQWCGAPINLPWLKLLILVYASMMRIGATCILLPFWCGRCTDNFGWWRFAPFQFWRGILGDLQLVQCLLVTFLTFKIYADCLAIPFEIWAQILKNSIWSSSTRWWVLLFLTL